MYKIIGMIGEGGFAKVYHLARVDSTSCLPRFCMPIASTTNDIFVAGGSSQIDELAMKEIKIENATSAHNELTALHLLNGVGAKGIIKLIDQHTDRYGTRMFFQKYDCDLFSKIIGWCKFDNNFTFNVLYNIAKIVREMHNIGVMHLDIKPENILMNENDFVLCDFGSSVVSKSVQTQQLVVHVAGTGLYAAPEILAYPIFASSKSDIYSIGVTAAVCFDSENHQSICKGNHPKMDSRLLDLIRRCCLEDIDERISIDELCEALNTLGVENKS